MVLFKLITRNPSLKPIIFTFHYGPIQIGGLWDESTSMYVFTFHYGPIQILYHRTKKRCYGYLHSTMVLFKWESKNKCDCRRYIYIPLWSYSNPLLLQYNNSLIKATTFVNPQHFHLDNSFFS